MVRLVVFIECYQGPYIERSLGSLVFSVRGIVNLVVLISTVSFIYEPTAA